MKYACTCACVYCECLRLCVCVYCVLLACLQEWGEPEPDDAGWGEQGVPEISAALSMGPNSSQLASGVCVRACLGVACVNVWGYGLR